MSIISKYANADINQMSAVEIGKLLEVYLDLSDATTIFNAVNSPDDSLTNSQKIELVMNSESHMINHIYEVINKYCGVTAKRKKHNIDDIYILVKLLGVDKNFEYILGYMDHERISMRNDLITIVLRTLVILAMVAVPIVAILLHNK